MLTTLWLQFLADGAIQIIDRKKNIFKLSQGEYVAAEELEGIFKKIKFVGQIWVYGNSFHTTLIAVIVPDPETIMPWCKANDVEGDYETAMQNPKVGGRCEGADMTRCCRWDADMLRC